MVGVLRTVVMIMLFAVMSRVMRLNWVTLVGLVRLCPVRWLRRMPISVTVMFR